MDLCLVLLVAGFIGARLFHIFFEGFSHYRSHPEEIFYFWQGGFVFYGGALTAYLAVFIFIKKFRLDFWPWHDVLAPVLAFSYSLGRLACFFVGCCYGKVCALPWALPLKQWNPESQKTEILLRHPTALYASGMEFLILCFLLFLERKKTIFGQRLGTGHLFLFWILLHSVNRMVMETFRDDPRGGEFYGLSLSMIISITLFLVSASAIIKKFSTPSLVNGVS